MYLFKYKTPLCVPLKLNPHLFIFYKVYSTEQLYKLGLERPVSREGRELNNLLHLVKIQNT